MCGFQGTQNPIRFPVTMAKGIHLFPYRTQKLSLSAPMVLGWTRPGRVGRCRNPDREAWMRNLRASLFCGFGVRRDRGREKLGRGKREGNGRRRGGTRAGLKVWLEGVSCVSGRTSSFPAGERNQRLPGAGEVSMRHAGPRTPLRQAACVGGASQGRPRRGSLRFRTNGPVENVPFSTMGLCLGEERRGG